MSNLRPATASKRLDEGLGLLRQVLDQRVVDLADRSGRVDADAGDVPLAGVPLEPVLHVAALVGVEHQHVGLGHALPDPSSAAASRPLR